MIPSLLKLRWPRIRRTTPAESVQTAVEPPPAPPPAPPWQHVPPQPRERATVCGHCGGKMPETSASSEWCGSICQAAYIAELSKPVHSCARPRTDATPQPTPEPVPDPPWLAAIGEWERAKAARLVAERKSPKGEAA